MPVCEADPWRLQYFEGSPCPDHVRVPTEDADAWVWYPAHRWIYDKLQVNNRVQAFRAAMRLGLIPFEPTFGYARGES